MILDPAILTTLAALAGSAIGASAPIFSNYVLQRGQTQRELLNQQISMREALYADFIKEAATLHAHSLSHELQEMESLVGLHAVVSRIRLFASEKVVSAAENLALQIVENYGKPNLLVEQIRLATLARGIDPLNEFSSACRAELREILGHAGSRH